jgi:hypothetical protein
VSALRGGRAHRVTNTMRELYLGVANDILALGMGLLPTASGKVEGLPGPQRTA